VLSYKPCGFNKYADPNKGYIYAVSGAIPIVTGDLESIATALSGHAITVDPADYENDLYAKYRLALEVSCEELNGMRERVYRYARSQLYWEKQEHLLLEALKSA